VWAQALSQPAILEGLRAGRAFVSVEGGALGMVFRASAGGASADMGGTLAAPAGSRVRFTTTLTGGEGRVEVVTDGRVRPELDGRDFVLVSDGRRSWVRVNVRAADGRLLLIGNPVYLNWPERR
jgi:hypothetical protein